MLYVAIAICVVALLVGLWQIFARGPRRRRAFGRAQRHLQEGSWQDALTTITAIQAEGPLSVAWQESLRSSAGECHHLAADQALKEKNYEDSLKHYVTAAPLLKADEGELRARVIDHMLAEARRLFSAGPAENDRVGSLLERTLALQSPCPEATFWQGLCLIRHGQAEAALTSLTAAHEQAGKRYLDPAFYLGVLLHRLGRAQEALRYLGEANRIDSSCPFVTWQMGLSLVAANGDSGLAMRALQRALGPRGFGQWSQKPDRAWAEAFPEGKSYVRRLTSKYPFSCPLLGSDLPVLIRQGQMSLAQAYYRQGSYQESADLFTKLLQECPPSVLLLRGVGLALARLQRYDQAYKHLRIALEQEQSKDPFTAGYLALCGALGKPTQPEDKPKNVAWAIRLLARFQVPGPLPLATEWAGLYSAVYAEARALNMEVPAEDQLLLCDVLASVHATNPEAAAAYNHLAATFPNEIRPQYAWLYCRAAVQHGVKLDRDLDLFAHTFRDSGPARHYYAQQNWSFDEVEYTYLQHTADRQPGQFPAALGAEYAPRGEAFLIQRSVQAEQAGRKDDALASMEVLLRLYPQTLAGHDRLACLHYRQGDLDRAVALLTGWQRLAPADHCPYVRQAVIEQQRGNAERRSEAIDRALGLTDGSLRASIAFLGARLALRQGVEEWQRDRQAEDGARGKDTPGTATGFMPKPTLTPPLAHSVRLLEGCLRDDPDHTEALWCLAAVRTVAADRDALAALAPRMYRPAVADARFHYLGAVCHLAAKDCERAIELGQRAAADESLTADSHYLMAWAHLHRQDAASAAQDLQKVARVDKSPSAVHARALLGHLSFARGAYDEAIRWWNAVDPRRRAEWQLDDPLRHTVLLSGLLAFENKRYEQAGERFREAGKLGLRDRRLGQLLTLALVKAGQRLLYEQTKTPAGV
jgi:tetratricopeptide (TPR) repeat protein